MSKRRGYKRVDGAFRDRRTFVIVPEGAVTEVDYFTKLAAKQRRVRVLPLPPPDRTSSAPVHALRRAIDFVTQGQLERDDQLWIVLDTDRWSEKQLMEVRRACDDKGWGLTISNPCFELWLYLHFADLPEDFDGGSKEMKTALKEVCAANNGYRPEEAVKNLHLAIERAASLDTRKDHLLPPRNVTQVYRLAQAIQEFLE
ncbi:RloB family protein [Lewinella sp. W8]|uniref:RloB family protein n=1 Tax=Lewinella sp. W8 TaxID=2528208 RepID=UPI00106752F6|nr:RloB family protein [Lewinella sp. W8]MTB53114.1 hypothetical protein [Lewinella sp. W8]